MSEISVNESLKCKGCAAVLHYVPGTRDLKCEYCGEVNAIATDDAPTQAITSVAYDSFLQTVNNLLPNPEIKVVKCTSCGSETNFNGNEAAGKCAFCASPLVIQLGKSASTLKPHYILPFILNEKQAGLKFMEWLSGLWFAPDDIVREAKTNTSLKGVYMPYWTYDSNTTTQYEGERGEYYYTTESYTVTVNGKSERRTRQVRHTRWRSASGTVHCDFNDVTIPASKSLPVETLTALNPWDFEKLEPYDERYISGLSAETYQTRPNEGLEKAKEIMDFSIRHAIKDDIGGDEQRISSYDVRYKNIAIKYVMLPVWVSAYMYGKTIYQFTVNACTGEVVGKRPYSAIKITLAIILGVIVASAIILLICYGRYLEDLRNAEAATTTIGVIRF